MLDICMVFVIVHFELSIHWMYLMLFSLLTLKSLCLSQQNQPFNHHVCSELLLDAALNIVTKELWSSYVVIWTQIQM